MGQRIRTLGERNPDSPVGAIKSVQALREGKLGKGLKQTRNKVVKEIKESIKKIRPKKEDWASFVQSLEC